MAKFDEMPLLAKVGVMLLIAGVIGIGFYFWPLGPINDEIKRTQAQLDDKKKENARLKEFEPKLAEINKTIAQLEAQLQEAKKIVPDDEEADQFIKLLHDTASVAGIEIRRYTAMPTAGHEFYTEIPFQLDLDGPYFSMLNFFDRIGKLERIINIANLQMTNTKNTGPSKVKTTYSYTPAETVVASCTATTFFSHDLAPPAPKPATAKP
jgi:type IV pilus assembly protein PilO